MQEDDSEGKNVSAAADLTRDRQKRERETWTKVLASLAETRDKRLFAELFSHFGPRIKAYIIRLGLPAASAEEVTQEAMLSVWRKAHMFNASKASASTWIYTLARNLCIDRMRKEKAVEYELPEDEVDPSPRHLGEHAILEQRMKAALGTLPEAQAQVLFLSYYEGKSHSEIAEQLGIPLGSVKSRLRLAFDKLKTHWEAQS
ncbi:sigma-70 family RNA polymerase sigma factor [Marinobacterium mangrovicola]|uniref:RNA polymerase sigma-70 factor (ECF subfamily) n=1 Tax=Marinobacterium mangrovicola TaxID=1476959 RepID=A0A4R1GIK0_9GAMM|nr:sigma-70 family RNA polymerase sigma factor [Marinobacterium mangrovicola]TCK08127.1 RNA polymerase sigma-70 factor (ECF subfamily) [Marinobacterium mangrovicola]